MLDDSDYRVKKLAQELTKANVPAEVFELIMAGGAEVHKKAKPEAKAAWLSGAMGRLDDLLDAETRHAVREGCACCLGGKRLEISKGIAKQHATLEGRIAAANEARFVFGHSVTMQDDGQILVRFGPDGEATFSCPCLKKAEGRLSITYCYCCGGHVKHHLQTALDRKLKVQVRSSVLSSGGTRNCSFLFSFAD